MTWTRFESAMLGTKKYIRASPLARLLYLEAIIWCNKNQNDGRITDRGAQILQIETGLEVACIGAELVERGLWEIAFDEDETDPDGGWWIHDYAMYQPTHDQSHVERALQSRKQALYRNTELIALIKTRDMSKCRYCAQEVSWTDKRSPKAARYDHVDPTGPNVPDNVVVACRFCTVLKGNRLPGAGGLKLLPPPDGSDPGPVNGIPGEWNRNGIGLKSESIQARGPVSRPSNELRYPGQQRRGTIDPVELSSVRARRVI